VFILTNGSERRWFGVDFHLRLPIGKALALGANATDLTITRGSLADLQFQPQALGYGYIEGERAFFNGELKAALRVSGRFIGERKGQWVQAAPLMESTVSLGHLSLLEVKGTFHYKDAIIGLSLDNMLNTRFEEVAGYPAPGLPGQGRRFRFEIVWEFLD